MTERRPLGFGHSRSIVADSRRYGHSSSEDGEDEEEDDDEENDATERKLSARYGEAEEAGKQRTSTSDKKRKQDGQDIMAEYAKELRARKQPRPKLTAEQLTGVEGLIRIPLEFKSIPYRATCKSIVAAAAYSKALMARYKAFCYDLLPGTAFEDVLYKIEQLGSKKEVKAYMQSMREDARNKRLEQLFGKDKAGKMIQELEHGLRNHGLFQIEGPPHDSTRQGSASTSPDIRRPAPVLGNARPIEACEGEEKETAFEEEEEDISRRSVHKKSRTLQDKRDDKDFRAEIRGKMNSMQGEISNQAPYALEDVAELVSEVSGT